MASNCCMVLPCDLPKWPKIRKLLIDLQSLRTVHEWTEYIEAIVFTYIHDGDTGLGGSGAERKCLFHVLEDLLEQLSTKEHNHVLHHTLPFIVESAVAVERFRQADDIFTGFKSTGM